MRKRTRTKSGGCRSAVWLDKTNVARRKTEVQLQAWTVSHGWLTPPALSWRDGSWPRYAYSTCELGMFDTGGYTPPLLFACRSPTDGITTFAMYKRTISARNGGCKPAVALGDVLAQAPPQMSGRLPTGVLTNAVAVVVAKPRGAYAPRSCSRAVRPPAELRLFRCTNAHPQERQVSARRGEWATHCNGVAQMLGRLPPVC